MQEIFTLITISASLLASLGGFSYFQWRVQKRALKLDLMTKVHERYSKLYKALACLEGHVVSFENLRDQDKEAISAYINLCAEQFHWRRTEKLIDDEVWNVWQSAMKQKFRQQTFADAWRKCHRQDVYYDGFAEFVDKVLEG